MDRKELKKQYAQAVRPMGILQVKNTVNGKIYLESAMNPQGKLNSLRFQLQQGSYMNRELQNDFTDAGEAAFTFEIVDELKPGNDDTKSRDDLAELTRMWMDRLQPYGDKGYNRKK